MAQVSGFFFGPIWDDDYYYDDYYGYDLIGTGYDDYIVGSYGSDEVDGRDGNDTIEGLDGNDTLAGKDGHDDVYGDDGHDIVTGGRGRDWLDGGRGNDRVGGGDGADTLWGGPGDDLIGGDNEPDNLYGNSGRDTLVGGNQNDTLDGGDGNDTLEGGNGLDTALYRDWLGREARFTRIDSDTILIDLPDGSRDRLVTMEQAEFADGVFDIREVTQEEAFVFRLYDAVYDRPADDGLDFWVNKLEAGMSEAEVAASFLDSAEYKAKFSDDLSDKALIEQLYEVVLGREGDTAGCDFWLGRLEDGLAREDMLLLFTESPENVAAHADELEAGMFYLG
ncbi:hypothetical protein LNKW23_06400 [Paralimibaculum aggregatum]|uniref:DUF4214 domain-containing protein n=1 Tax=Paralimibaculum aggregatum TaxID=3036245 RepID=A0ABQ6LIF0_9RHOB|nr:DUF4214 domain-containing protein [Limibaculum sp. NKW23]GMG81427.1 hypothetical protein LNKW23_06400 [Limibaculum sp. NKW23]